MDIPQTFAEVKKCDIHDIKLTVNTLSDWGMLIIMVQIAIYKKFGMQLYYQVANYKGADQTVRMRRLICAFVVRIWHKQVFSCRDSYKTAQAESQEDSSFRDSLPGIIPTSLRFTFDGISFKCPASMLEIFLRL